MIDWLIDWLIDWWLFFKTPSLILISSVSLSGLATEVTFFPQNEGTPVDLGNQVFPFSYVANYYYGTYNCYVPTYAYTYTIAILGPTPTPTSP